MTLTLEHLQQLRADCVRAREAYIGQANACTGKIDLLDELIAQAEPPAAFDPAPPRAEPPMPASE
jgi:hypothetical protein